MQMVNWIYYLKNYAAKKMMVSKQTKKTLPKNVFEIVGESGQTIERVDSNKTEDQIEKSKQIQEKPTFSERTTKRRVNKSYHQFYLILLIYHTISRYYSIFALFYQSYCFLLLIFVKESMKNY